MHARLSWTILLCLPISGACATTVHDYRGPRMSRTLFEEPRRELPRRVVVLPAQAVVYRLNEKPEKGLAGMASMFLADPEASARASAVLDRAATQEFENGSPFELVALPELGEAEHANVNEHVALFHDVVWAALNCNPWRKAPDFKLREFDYSLGPGLAALKEQTGADAGLFIGASAVELIAGLVDLTTGDLLWVNSAAIAEAHSWEDTDMVRALLRKLWAPYPGLEAFARLRRKA